MMHPGKIRMGDANGWNYEKTCSKETKGTIHIEATDQQISPLAVLLYKLTALRAMYFKHCAAAQDPRHSEGQKGVQNGQDHAKSRKTRDSAQ